MSFPETMKKNVIDRMNMLSSTFENPLPGEYHSLAATGYRSNGDTVEGNWPIYPEMAAAGLWTTPGELIQYAIEIQRISQSKQDGILTYASVVEMLTAGMNDHGLGPGVGEHTFGHGGADEGFRARLVAWKNKPYAVVVMVNSDNGTIIQELLLAIASEYDLPGIEPTIREIANIPTGDLQKFVGSYELDNMGTMKIGLYNGQLRVDADFMDEPVQLLPQSETEFFDSSDGTIFEFDVRDNGVQGFNAQGMRAERIE